MARVLVPVVPRHYNHNSRGSSTAVVTMRGENPFERSLAGPEGIVRTASQLPGMGFWGLGDDATPSTGPLMFMQAPASSPSQDATAISNPPAIQQLQTQSAVPMQTTPVQSNGFDWSSLTKSIISAGQAVAVPIIQNNLAKHQRVPGSVTQYVQQFAPQKHMSNTTKVMIGVGVIGAALALTMILKKKRK